MNSKFPGSQVVIIKSYNDEDYIEQCVDSVLSQKNFNFLDVFFIDDNSQDKTTDKIIKYKKYFKHCEFRTANLGASHNFEDYNSILKKYDLGYISILSGDDYWPKEKTQRHQDVFSQFDIGLHFGLGKIIGLKKNQILPKKNLNENNVSGLRNKDNKIFLSLIKNNYIPSFASAYSIQHLKKIGGFIKYPKNNISIDFSTILYLSKISKFYFTNEILGYWRTSLKQQSSTQRVIQVKKDYLFLKHFRKVVLLNENSLKKKYDKNLKTFLIQIFYEQFKKDIKDKKDIVCCFKGFLKVVKYYSFSVISLKALVLIIFYKTKFMKYLEKKI